MIRVRARGELVRRFILGEVVRHPKEIVRVTAEEFRISRQAANKHLANLVEQGAIIASGNTSSRIYRLAPLVVWQGSYPIEAAPTEDTMWENLSSQMGQLPENVGRIWQYACTEILNNAREHSGGTTILVSMNKTAQSTEVTVFDDGVGIFRKIKAALDLADERHAVLELAKGKFTTDPARHTGEGIFFTSRSVDDFQISSSDVYFSHEFGQPEDWILESTTPPNGTLVRMRLHNHTARSLPAIMAEYEDEDRAFTRTVVPVRLTRYGDDNLVSRSQARRLLSRVDRFRTVILDFAGVDSIGPSFADEIFRVFTRQHPEVSLVEIKASPEVAAMITRGRSGGLSAG